MKRDFLKNLGIEGLTDEVIDKIISENGKDIQREQLKAEKISGDLENIQSQLKEKDQLIEEANVQIEKFKGMDVESKDKAIQDWQEKYKLKEEEFKTKETEYQQKLQQQQYDFKIDEIARGHKFVDKFVEDAFKENLRKQAFKIGEDGSLQGVNDYINKMKEEHKGIFVVEEAPSNPLPEIVKPGNTTTVPNNGFNFSFNAVRPVPKE